MRKEIRQTPAAVVSSQLLAYIIAPDVQKKLLWTMSCMPPISPKTRPKLSCFECTRLSCRMGSSKGCYLARWTTAKPRTECCAADHRQLRSIHFQVVSWSNGPARAAQGFKARMGGDHRAERELFLADQAETSSRCPGHVIGSLVIHIP
jgi:hypothetical protein